MFTLPRRIAISLLLLTPSLGHSQGYEPPTLDPEACNATDLPEASRLACEQIRATLEQFADEGETLGRKAADIIEEVSTRTVSWDDEGPHDRIAIENPLDANDGTEGEEKAWEEYVEDSKLLLNDSFMGCLEPRAVINHPEYNPICRAICPRKVRVMPGCPRCGDNEPPPFPGAPPCVEQRHIVLEYYLPVYEIAANKAGSRSLDVEMFRRYDDAPELTRSRTQEHQEEVDKPGMEEAMADLGLPSEDIEWPSWHRVGTEAYLQNNAEGFNVTDAAQSFSIGYQTNLHAQATRDRPFQYWEGFLENPKSGLWCFNDPGKKIVANSMDHGDGVYSLLSRAAELTEIAWPEAYEATVNLPWDLQRAGRGGLPQDITPHFRSAEWPHPFGELERTGIEPGGGVEHKDWVFFGGTLAPFNVSRFNAFTDPVRADIFRNATAALLFGSPRRTLGLANTYKKRLLQFTLYENRHADAREGYTGSIPGVEDSIVSVDKLQLIYPPIQQTVPRRGTECFRIENMPNNEPGGRSGDTALKTTSTGHIEIPKDLRKQFLEHGLEELNRANETRVAVWTKRVLCACERCGRPFGCTTLNNGDYEEDNFAGNGLEFTSPPPPFEQLMPFLHGYAEKNTPPRLQMFQLDLLSQPVQVDDGKTGPTPGETPPGLQVKPDPISFPEFIFAFCRSGRMDSVKRGLRVELFKGPRPQTNGAPLSEPFSIEELGILRNCTAGGCSFTPSDKKPLEAGQPPRALSCRFGQAGADLECTGRGGFGSYYSGPADLDSLPSASEFTDPKNNEGGKDEQQDDDDDDEDGGGGSSSQFDNALLVGCRTMAPVIREALRQIKNEPDSLPATTRPENRPFARARARSDYRF